MKKYAAVFWAFFLAFVGGFAFAQTTVKADQGRPGNQGPWPVTLTGGTTLADGGTAPSTTLPYPCAIASPNSITSVTNASTTTPATAQAGRVWTNVCNSPQNAAGSIVKCRADGTAPVFAAGNAGDVLELGDCVTYTVPASRNILCISNSAGGISTLTYECY